MIFIYVLDKCKPATVPKYRHELNFIPDNVIEAMKSSDGGTASIWKLSNNFLFKNLAYF